MAASVVSPPENQQRPHPSATICFLESADRVCSRKVRNESVRYTATDRPDVHNCHRGHCADIGLWLQQVDPLRRFRSLKNNVRHTGRASIRPRCPAYHTSPMHSVFWCRFYDIVPGCCQHARLFHPVLFCCLQQKVFLLYRHIPILPRSVTGKKHLFFYTAIDNTSMRYVATCCWRESHPVFPFPNLDRCIEELAVLPRLHRHSG